MFTLHHVSHAMSRVTCEVSDVTWIFLFKEVDLLGWGFVITRAYKFIFHFFFFCGAVINGLTPSIFCIHWKCIENSLLYTPPGRRPGTTLGGERRGWAGRKVFFFTNSWFAHIRSRKQKPLLKETMVTIYILLQLKCVLNVLVTEIWNPHLNFKKI